MPPEERTRLWRRAVAKTRGGCALTVGVGILFAVGMSTLGRFANRATSNLGEFVTMVAGACVVGAIVGLLLVNFTYRRARKQLRSELRAAGRCVRCGYDLRGSPDLCPECGTPAPPISAAV